MSWFTDFLTNWKDADGTINWSKILGTGAAGAGLISLINNSDSAREFLGIGGANTNQPVGYQGGIPKYTATRTQLPITPDPNRRPGAGGRRYFSDVTYTPVVTAAQGGLASLPQSRGYYLGGATDGMADKVPARIDNTQEAKLSDGEFVLPADIVSHLGNGNSQAGAKVLYDMMDRVRRARTGRVDQGRQINPNKYTPA
jgi:hypothetical protein